MNRGDCNPQKYYKYVWLFYLQIPQLFENCVRIFQLVYPYDSRNNLGLPLFFFMAFKRNLSGAVLITKENGTSESSSYTSSGLYPSKKAFILG